MTSHVDSHLMHMGRTRRSTFWIILLFLLIIAILVLVYNGDALYGCTSALVGISLATTITCLIIAWLIGYVVEWQMFGELPDVQNYCKQIVPEYSACRMMGGGEACSDIVPMRDCIRNNVGWVRQGRRVVRV